MGQKRDDGSGNFRENIGYLRGEKMTKMAKTRRKERFL